MADLKISQLTAISVLTPATDVLPVVDVGGVTKKITTNQILGSGGVASLASATITGALDAARLNVTAATIPANGVYLVTTNKLGLSTNSVERLNIDATGNLTNSTTATQNGFLLFNNSIDGGNLGYVGNAKALMTGGSASSLGIRGESSIQFSIATALGMTLNSTGNVVLKGGTAGATGVGVTFPATQVVSSDANCLDDYEEGTWTPVFQGTTTTGTYVYSTQVGRYTKVGNLVTVFGQLVISSITLAATGVMRIGGLPFTTSSVNAYAAAAVGWIDLITISSGTLALSVNLGGVVIDMYRILSGAGVGFIAPSDLVVNTRINFTATYSV
jgi:hypothetical protein